VAERRESPSGSAKRAAHTRTGKRGGGLWHHPQALNLLSNALLLFSVLGLGLALVTWVFSKQLFPLRELVLSAPPSQVTQAQLEYVARTAIKGNFFTAKLEDVRAAFEKLPWVRHTEVRRLWPDGLELSLEEHEAVAYWKNIGDGGEDVRLINRQGEVFAASSDVAMPEFSGPPGSAASMLEYYETYSRILQPLEAKLVRMDLSMRGVWRLWLDNGLSIVLDREQKRPPIEGRLENFVAAWVHLQDRLGGRIAHADLRYPNGFALALANHKTVPQGSEQMGR
jgi:cell division protein FtsQ